MNNKKDNIISNNNRIKEVVTYPVPMDLKEIKENFIINTDNNISKQKIINKAFKLHAQGNIKEAEKYYQYFLNQGYQDSRVLTNYGLILKKHGNFKEAEIWLRKAIQIDPNCAISYSNLGNFMRKIDNLKEAEIFTRKAIHLKPNFAEAYSNLGSILRDLGELKEAELSLRKAIKLKPFIADAYNNLGNILRDLGELKQAEISFNKAIQIDPNCADAFHNLGNNMQDLGNLEFAEKYYIKAIKIQSDLTKAYYSLSKLKYSNKKQKWKDELFNKNILKNKLPKDKVDIYFARANIYHNERKYKQSSKCLQLANKIKLKIKPSFTNKILNKSKELMIESYKEVVNKKQKEITLENIFIVGIPRSGSTLLESILSMNLNVDDLGEINILEESFQESKKNNQNLTLFELYFQKLNNNNKSYIKTNKYLFNYQYVGIIAKQIPNVHIIHCFRNPLDNILSIYRSHFAQGNEYASSLVDCAYIFLDHDYIMTEYKDRYRSKIYDLNYDLLVKKPNQEIKALISWLGWEWDNSYLSPHLNPRSVSTASSVQVRSPINLRSVGGWKNYREMLRPVIKVLEKHEKYKNLQFL